MYNYGARFYDPAIARFTPVDRFAEEFPEWSGYHYANDNPIVNIDFNGDSTKYTPNMMPYHSPSDLLSIPRYLNNVSEGFKTAYREFFTPKIGNGFKNLGSSVEYAGYTVGMTGRVETAGVLVVTGKVLDAGGTVIIVINELIENSELSAGTYFDISVDLMVEILHEPLEDGIDKLGLPAAVSTIFKSHRDAVIKASVDYAKQEVKSVMEEESQNCNEVCKD